jgi:hypothetical protein
MYPAEFSAEARAHIEVEILKASKELIPKRKEIPESLYAPAKENEENLHKYILRVFLAFAMQACRLGTQGEWTADRIRSQSLDSFAALRFAPTTRAVLTSRGESYAPKPLGQSDARTTMGYTHAMSEDARRFAARLGQMLTVGAA